MLFFFSSSLRDDPLPESATLAPTLGDIELVEGGENLLSETDIKIPDDAFEDNEIILKNTKFEIQPMLISIKNSYLPSISMENIILQQER